MIQGSKIGCNTVDASNDRPPFASQLEFVVSVRNSQRRISHLLRSHCIPFSHSYPPSLSPPECSLCLSGLVFITALIESTNRTMKSNVTAEWTVSQQTQYLVAIELDKMQVFYSIRIPLC